MALQHAPQRLGGLAEMRSSAMVLKAGEDARRRSLARRISGL
jgi:hypothetical protein